ncbi:hypothetical protein FE783_31295 [Paenibacillus mesophilus]|uniref:glycosylhydrolase-like jelly roll fold domain-containing protein n=1 Tax=Paenibacillus mesophilus TaxID=2582849 RepID=UPI00110F1925|nr:glycosylhydrolase-like jelly roll fold domain-containing protein [Paenibacillus mesophilus]TMV44820.1 hypothetical protein FE783_31295 [Paenibacillus mesophilus]
MKPGNNAAAIDSLKKQFIEPDDEFSPLPFWFWNGSMNRDEIIKQIRDFSSKGVAGFVIHPRLGMSESTPYLSDSYMDLVEAAVEEAERLRMKVILYDEAMYPSGSAMGMVAKENPAFASRGLKLIEMPCNGGECTEFAVPIKEGETLVSAQAVVKTSDRAFDPASIVLLEAERGSVKFTPPDNRSWAILLFVETYSKGVIRGVYFGQDDVDPDAPPSADLLNPKATETFIRLTHEAYYRKLKRFFGSTVIAMFTDEPNIMGRAPIRGLKPWTDGFLAYARSFGLEEKQLPALWLDAGGRTSEVRAAYAKAVNAKLAHSYYRPLSDWCAEHGIQLTGHPGHSDEIGLLEYFQLPGQDIVWRVVEPGEGKGLHGADSTLGKCSSDAARHRGRRRNLNECFGACFKAGMGWYFTADEMKWYMDWLFVRGVNMLVPHAFYYSIEGKRRDERPPDVGPNSIWWPHYRTISDYMKRMSWLMTDSVNAARVAVLCEEDRMPWEIAVPLYEHQIEFNYLEERLFADRCELRNGAARIGEYGYPVIVVDRPERFADKTRARLAEFAKIGGTVIVASEAQAEVEAAVAVASKAQAEAGAASAAVPVTASTSAKGIGIAADGRELPAALDRLLPRDVTLVPACPDIRSSHVRKGDVHFYLFVNEGEERWEGTVELGTAGFAEKWDPWEGSAVAQPLLPSASSGKSAVVPLELERRGSVILCIDPSRPAVVSEPPEPDRVIRTVRLDSGWSAIVPGTEAGSARPVGLGSWTAWEGMNHYSGEVVYENELHLEQEEAGAGRVIRLDLGDAEEMTAVELNGVPLGVRFWKPYRYADVSAAVRPGANKLRVTVTNSLANAYNGASLPSGLFGPVTADILEI